MVRMLVAILLPILTFQPTLFAQRVKTAPRPDRSANPPGFLVANDEKSEVKFILLSEVASIRRIENVPTRPDDDDQLNVEKEGGGSPGGTLDRENMRQWFAFKPDADEFYAVSADSSDANARRNPMVLIFGGKRPSKPLYRLGFGQGLVIVRMVPGWTYLIRVSLPEKLRRESCQFTLGFKRVREDIGTLEGVPKTISRVDALRTSQEKVVYRFRADASGDLTVTVLNERRGLIPTIRLLRKASEESYEETKEDHVWCSRAHTRLTCRGGKKGQSYILVIGSRERSVGAFEVVLSWGEFLLPAIWFGEVFGDTLDGFGVALTALNLTPPPPKIRFGDRMCVRRMKDGLAVVGEIVNLNCDAAQDVAVQLRRKKDGRTLDAWRVRQLAGAKCMLFLVGLNEKTLGDVERFDLVVTAGHSQVSSKVVTIKRGGTGYEVQDEG